MKQYNNLTVIITTFRSDEKIFNCIKSIDPEVSILVIENSNREEFKKKIEEHFSNAKCYLSGENLGYGKANNLGLSYTKTKYALILNPDAELQKDTLNNFFLRVEKTPNFAIIGPHIQEEHKIDTLKTNELIKVDNVKGFAMFLNLEQLDKSNVFDENIFIYFEEIDLCKRLMSSNKNIYLDPSIRIIHPGGSSHDENVNDVMELSRNWHWMWSSFYFHKKYKGFFLALLIIAPKLISAVFKSSIYYFLNKKKYYIYSHRLSGLINSILGKKSWYRPNL